MTNPCPQSVVRCGGTSAGYSASVISGPPTPPPGTPGNSGNPGPPGPPEEQPAQHPARPLAPPMPPVPPARPPLPVPVGMPLGKRKRDRLPYLVAGVLAAVMSAIVCLGGALILFDRR